MLKPRRIVRLPSTRSKNDDTAHRRRHDQVDATDVQRAHLGGQRPAQPFGPARVHQHAGALQVAGAVQPGGQHEMPFKQRTRRPELTQHLVLGHGYVLSCQPVTR
jgi:hypothetical protein